MAPNVGAIVFQIERQIAHDGNVSLSAVFSERLPLAEEFVLNEFVIADGVRSGFDFRVKTGPGYALIRFAKTHEESELIEPRGMSAFEFLIVPRFREFAKGLFQERLFV